MKCLRKYLINSERQDFKRRIYGIFFPKKILFKSGKQNFFLKKRIVHYLRKTGLFSSQGFM